MIYLIRIGKTFRRSWGGRFFTTILLSATAIIIGTGESRSQSLQLHGFVEYDHFSFLKANDDAINSRNQGIVNLQLKAATNNKASLFTSIEIRDDQSDVKRNRVYLDEAYLNLYYGHLDFRIGKQVIVWGKADRINPTDNITPWDYSDLLDTEDERIAIVSLRASYFYEDWIFEGVLVPGYRKSELPDPGSRWLPALPAQHPNPLYPTLGPKLLDTYYVFENPRLPDQNIANLQFGGRISGSTEGFDYAVSYFNGRSDTPYLFYEPRLAGDSLIVTVRSKYGRRNIFGVDFATTMGGFGLRGEAAYFLTEDRTGNDPSSDDPYIQYVVGVDRRISNIIGSDNLFVLVQWIKEISLFNTVYRYDDLNHLFRNSIMLRLEYEYETYSRLILEGIYSSDSRDYYVKPSVELTLLDGVELLISADFLGGKTQSFFGMFRDNDRMQFKVKYSF